MGQFASVILPVYLLVGLGYLAAWRKLFDDKSVDALMRFAQSFAAPVLLFQSIAQIDLTAEFDMKLLVAFYAGAFGAFLLAALGSSRFLGRSGEDSVAIGFAAMFSNSLLLGIPITQRAYGVEALTGNWIIIAVHSPLLYTVGITVMEFTKAKGQNLGIGNVAVRAFRGVIGTPLVMGIMAGFAVNIAGLGGFALPEPLWAAVRMFASSALPTALFALGGILMRYRPAGNITAIALCCGASLIVHPLITYGLAGLLGVSQTGTRSAVMTAAMAPGVNAYIFAHLYGAAQRVAASAVLVATGLSLLTIWMWLTILG